LRSPYSHHGQQRADDAGLQPMSSTSPLRSPYTSIATTAPISPSSPTALRSSSPVHIRSDSSSLSLAFLQPRDNDLPRPRSDRHRDVLPRLSYPTRLTDLKSPSGR
jgi:hypothetical protein